MLEILQFIFQDVWHWLGTLSLIMAIGSAAALVAGAARGR